MTKPRKSVAFVPETDARLDNAATGFIRLSDLPDAEPAAPRPVERPAPPPGDRPRAPAPGPEASGDITRLTEAEFGLRYYRDGAPLFAGPETEVHVAVDAGVAEGVNATVCIKHFRKTDARSDAWRNRLKRELKVLTRAQHRNLPALRGAYETETGGYMVTELWGVDTLRSQVERHGKLSEQAAVQIARDVGEALDALHHAGVLHRDIRAENVVVRSQPDGSWAAQLVDFDSAWFFDLEPTPPPLRHHEGALSPPEQSPEGDTWSRAADLYLWGQLLVHALTGTTATAALARSRSPLAQLATRLLHPQPNQRPATVRAALDELDRAPAGAAATPAKTKAKKNASGAERRPWLLLGGLAVCGLLTGIILNQHLGGPPPPPPGPRVTQQPPRTGADAPPPPTPPEAPPLPGGFPDQFKLAEQRVDLAMTMSPKNKAARIEKLEREALDLLAGSLRGHAPVDEATERLVRSIRSEGWHTQAYAKTLVALRTAMAAGDQTGVRVALETLYTLDPSDEGLAFGRRVKNDLNLVWEDR
jgi:serine/threonine protein kinase